MIDHTGGSIRRDTPEPGLLCSQCMLFELTCTGRGSNSDGNPSIRECAVGNRVTPPARYRVSAHVCESCATFRPVHLRSSVPTIKYVFLFVLV
jgi:hypothetical protein